ncbi:hypothetical protein SESBI_46833, partial [Sesbania bispinosa]
MLMNMEIDSANGAATSDGGAIGYGDIRKFISDQNAETVYNSTFMMILRVSLQ